jgi:seryl-tRNA synthetase
LGFEICEKEVFMPQKENEEAQETQQTLMARLEQEKAARATLEEAMAAREARIAELEAEGETLRAERSNLQALLSEAKKEGEAKASELEASMAELAKAREASASATAKYREALVAAHPEIPQELIAGDSIDELFSSVERGKAVVESVKKLTESQAAATKVPAGAPPRQGISTEGMSPRDMIAAGIQQGNQK